MLPLTLLVASLCADIGQPVGVHLLEDSPLLAQTPPSLIPLPESDAQVSVQQIQADLEALRRARPKLGGAIGLMAGGGGASLVGAFYFLLSPLTGAIAGLGVSPFLLVGAVALALGIPLMVVGVWLLYNRIDERSRIDAESSRLRVELHQVSSGQQRPQRSMPLSTQPPQVQAPTPSMVMARF